MNKKQLKTIAGIINQTNANEKTRAMFNVINGNAYFTPDGNVGYKLPMDILYDVEEAHGITIPEASGRETIYNAIEKIDYSICYYTELKAKEFLAELKAYYKEVKTKSLSPETAFYKIKFKDKIHGYRIALMINILTVIGNNAEIYIEDGRFGKMYVTSDIGRAVLLAVRVPDNSTTANKTI